MKALVLLASPEADWHGATPEERQAVMDDHTAFHKAVAERATMLGGEALANTPEGRTLRHVDGAPVVTEGPFAETTEQIGGRGRVARPGGRALPPAPLVVRRRGAAGDRDRGL